jgi:hypothetical protein
MMTSLAWDKRAGTEERAQDLQVLATFSMYQKEMEKRQSGVPKVIGCHPLVQTLRSHQKPGQKLDGSCMVFIRRTKKGEIFLLGPGLGPEIWETEP